MRLPEFTETAHPLINAKHVHKSSQDLAKMTTKNKLKKGRERKNGDRYLNISHTSAEVFCWKKQLIIAYVYIYIYIWDIAVEICKKLKLFPNSKNRIFIFF